MGATSGAGFTYTSRGHGFSLVFSWVCAAQSFYSVVFCRSLFILLLFFYFLVIALYFLSSDLRLLVIPLESSIFSS
jgi:hypothetical protein